MTKKKTASFPTCAPVQLPGSPSPDYAYTEDCWGERGSDELGVSRAERMHGSAFARKSMMAADPLTYAFIGRASRLPWWTGPNGLLAEAMPILSEDQVEGLDGEKTSAPIREQLADLWFVLRREAPTRAAALTQWVSKAILVTEAVRLEMQNRLVDFIPFDAQDELEDVPGEFFKQSVNFREHHKDAIYKWFRENCLSYRVTEFGELDDRPAMEADEIRKGDYMKWPQPEWWDDEDPILSLPKRDQSRCLSLLEALTGKIVQDTSPRFESKGTKASYKQISEFIGLAREYERLIWEITEMKWSGEKASEDKFQILYLRDTILFALDNFLRKFGSEHVPEEERSKRPRAWDPDLTVQRFYPRGEKAYVRERVARRYELDSFYAALVRDRQRAAAKTRGEEGEEGATTTRRMSFKRFIAALLIEMFDEDIVSDPVVKAMIATDRHSAMLTYDELFRVDRDAGTIVHSELFKREFALNLGTHSEAVARRIARAIFELYEDEARASNREDDLERVVMMMAAYRMEGSLQQESELWQLLPESEVRRFRAEWENAESTLRRLYDQKIQEDRREVFADVQTGRYEPADYAEVQPFGFLRRADTTRSVKKSKTATPNGRSRHFIFNPVALLFHRGCAA